ncbi:hypothetical protein [Acidianus sp. RZ1]|uniref:hypothetical protein n=1 Tax=Acidianus sp. RZ1 TaxID=1540082 RepID=UPI0014920A17|nr:hypothetical protein [Acidianus sp. RZ1]NON61145.1 hypothetical protein [Acidianus sp. RZ1]
MNRGGHVIWLGDVPFFYRVKCVKENVKDKILENVKSLPEFFKNKFSEIIVDNEYGTCFRDTVYYYHIGDDFSIRFIGYYTNYLEFLDLGSICYLTDKIDAEVSITGKLLEYDDKFMLRPVKLKGFKYTHLTYAKLQVPTCKGEYAGAWIREVGKGYFIRLYDSGVSNSGQVDKAIKLGMKIVSSLRA